MTWPQEENGSPVAFTKDGKSVYVQSSLGYDTTRLLQVCLLHSVMQAQVSIPVLILKAKQQYLLLRDISTSAGRQLYMSLFAWVHRSCDQT